MELWMLKTSRLLLSNNNDDYFIMSQMLQDSLDPSSENKIFKMTLKDALMDIKSNKNSAKAPESLTKKTKNIETNQNSKSSSKRHNVEKGEDTEKRKIHLTNIDLFSPVPNDQKRRRCNSSNKDKSNTNLSTSQDNDACHQLINGEMLNSDVMLMPEFSDLQCTVCRVMSISSDNMLLECATCKVLYHQKCHQPPVTNESALQSSWWCQSCSSAASPVDLTVSSLSSKT